MAKSKYKPDHCVYEVSPGFEVYGRVPAMTLMNNVLVPGSHNYVEMGWATDMPKPPCHIGAHVHAFDELVFHIGTDPDNQEDLGGEVEFIVGDETLLLTTTCCVFVPKGVKHGPITWKKFVRPHFQLTVMIGADTLADADPGGHEAAH